jgi:hypothetical protein
MDIEKVAKQISDAQTVILNKLRSYEDIVNASVWCVNALADLEHERDVRRAEICLRAENTDAPAARIKNILKNETIEIARLITIAKGYRNTLRNLEYREGR